MVFDYFGSVHTEKVIAVPYGSKWVDLTNRTLELVMFNQVTNGRHSTGEW